MSDQSIQTKTVKTPVGEVEVELKQFINGYDDEAIEAALGVGARVTALKDPQDPTKTIFHDKASIEGVHAWEREKVRRIVVSVGGVSGTPDQIIDMVYGLDRADTIFIQKEVNKIVTPPEAEPKKKDS